MSIKFKDLPFTKYYKKINNITKKIQSLVFPNDVQIGVNQDLSASITVYGTVSASNYLGLPSNLGGGGTLNDSYDYGGSGSGRAITVDAGAIQFQGTQGINSLEVSGTIGVLGGITASNGSFGEITATTYLNLPSTGGTLDEAYDFGGSGAGRAITVDAGAIQLQGTQGINSLEVTGTIDTLGTIKATAGFSGSLTNLLNGTSYIAAGSNITVTSASNGQIVVSGDNQGVTLDGAYDFGGSGAGRAVTVDAGAIQLQGSQGTNSLEVTGTIDTLGTVKATAGLSGSLTSLLNGTSYIAAGSNITVTSASNGQIVIAGDTQGVTLDGAYDFGGSGAGRTVAVDAGAIQFQGSQGTNSLEVSGTIDTLGTIKATAGFSGSLTSLLNGTSYIAAGSNITVTSASNGQIVIAGDTQGVTLDGAYDFGGSGAGRAVTVDAGAIQLQGTQGINSLEVSGTIDTLGTIKATAGFSGSLTNLLNGTSYIKGKEIIEIISESNGSLTIVSPRLWQYDNSSDLLETTSSVRVTGTLTVGPENDSAQMILNTSTINDAFIFYARTGTLLFGHGMSNDNFSIFDNNNNSTVWNGTDFSWNFPSFITASLGFSGSLTRLTDGTSYIAAGSNITVTSASNGQIVIGSSADGGVTLDGAYDFGGSGAGRAVTVDAGAIQLQGSQGTNSLEVTGTIDTLGTVKATAGLSGSLTKLTDGTSYIETTENGIYISSSSNGPIVLSSNVGLYTGSSDPSSGLGNQGDLFSKNTGIGSLWYKRTSTLWGQIGPQRAFFNARFQLVTGDATIEKWVPWDYILDAATIDYSHELLMPTSGRIERITVRADQALDSSCDIEVHSAPDGSSTFSLIDSDLSLNLATANTAGQTGSVSVAFNQFDVIAINIQSATISTTTNVILMMEVVFD